VAQERKQVNFTPQQVSSVLAQIVTAGKDQLKSVYDPTCGSGLLLRGQRSQERQCFYGQEMNPTTYNLCRMNMIMHDALQAFRYQERRHLRATATFRYAF
jgi:type I restriction-modification system DNA methylase subunit